MDIIFYYHAAKIEQEKQRQLLIVASSERNGHFHTSFLDTKYLIDLNGAILNDKFYYIRENCGRKSLQVIDPMSKQNKVLCYSTSILSYVAVCACNRFLYLIGGYINETISSDQVLRYDPLENSLVTWTPMGSKRSRSATIFYQGSLYVIGGYDGTLALNSVGKYDPKTNKWTALASMCVPRWNHSVAVLGGKLYACGGIKLDSVEVYDPAKNNWQLLDSMNKERYHFLLIAHEDKLLAAIERDDERTVEVYDPSKNQWKIDKEMSSGLQLICPRGGFISSCCIDGEK